MTPTPPSVLYLVPDLFGLPGGIARYCRMVTKALEGDTRLSVVALHDAPNAPLSFTESFAYYPCAGSRQRFAQKVLHLFWKVRPALIIVGHVHLTPVVAWLCKITHTPFVQFLYGIEVWEPLSAARRWAVGQAARSIAISHFTAQRANEVNGFSKTTSLVLYNCLDPALAMASVKANNADRPSLLTVSRLSHADSYKGVDVALRAFAVILPRFPEARYHIVGDGDAKTTLETLAAHLGIEHAVCFHGRVSDDVLRHLYAQARVFVMPSRYEGFGFVFLEAMAQGTPAVGGNLDATPEVIVDGVTGYTVDPLSAQAVADAVLSLLENPIRCTQMGAAAQTRARDVFGYMQFRTQLLTYLHPYLKQ